MPNRTFAPLVVAVVGLSTPYVYWCFDLVTRVVQALTGSTIRLHVATLPQLREGFDNRNGGSVVITADLPEADLAHFVCASGIPIIAISDDLVDTLAWVKMTRKVSDLGSTKFCTLNLSALAPALLNPRTFHMDASLGDHPEIAVAKVIEYLFPTQPEMLAAATLSYIVEQGFVPVYRNDGQAMVLREEENTKVNEWDIARPSVAALRSYASLLSGVLPTQIIWPLELFSTFEKHPPFTAFDLTGPSRTLLYGPYLHLPEGTWIARVEFEISEASTGVETAVDVRVHDVFVEKKFVMPARGIFAYELEFEVKNSWNEVEIRIHMTKGAIEGLFLPRSVTVRPLEHPEIGMNQRGIPKAAIS